MLLDDAKVLVAIADNDIGEGKKYKNQKEAATALGLTYYAFKARLSAARQRIDLNKVKPEQEYKPSDELLDLPVIQDDDKPIEEIIEDRSQAFLRKQNRLQKKELVEIKVKETYKGNAMPIGFCIFGDMHIDDPYCDLITLKKHFKIVQENQPYVTSILLGDHLNNWVGYLVRNFQNSETTQKQAWDMVQWIIDQSLAKLIISGNHGAWSGAGDPVKWMQKPKNAVEDDWAIRAKFTFPNGRDFQIYQKHNFKGTSIYNKLHGVLRAAMFGAGRGAHVYIAGHLHIGSVMQTHLEEAGEVVWLCRAKGYKWWDDYAHEKLNIEFDADSNGCESVFVVVDPNDRNPWSWVTCFADVEAGANFLNSRRAAAKAKIDAGLY
tara:strand:- start:1356 stop:2489 length:1134 start_codon:yes stop_codon:yes gene_type:complete